MRNRLALAVAGLFLLTASVSVGTASAGSSLHVAATAQFGPWSTYSMRFDTAHNALWFIEVDGANVASLVKLNPTTLAVESSTPVDVQGVAYDLSVGLDHEWVVNFPFGDLQDPSIMGSISEYDSNGNLVKTFTTYGHGPTGVAFLNGQLWVANHHQDAVGTGGSVVEINPQTYALEERVHIGQAIFCCGPGELAVADGAIWAGVPNLDGIVRIDPTTLGTTLIPGEGGGGQYPEAACGEFTGDPTTHRLWVTDGFCRPSSILQLDTTTNTVSASINPGGVAAGLAFANGAVWASVADNGRGKSGFLSEIDPATGTVRAKLPTPGTGDVAVGDGSVYVESEAAGEIIRVTQ